jgi:hypothetical protein
MPLSERLRNPPPRVTGSECSVCLLLRELPKSESAALQTMLDDYSWTANHIYDAVTGEGHTIGRQTIGRHRRGDCSGLRNGRTAA